MAKYDVTYSCGHTGTVNLYGPNAQRERAIWVCEHRQVCAECQAAERAKASEKANQYAANEQLPELSGSDKQVDWAERIRADMLQKIERQMQDGIARTNAYIADNPDQADRMRAEQAECVELVRKLLAYISGIDKASWWIDNRDSSMRALNDRYREQIDAYDAAIAVTIDPVVQDVVDEATMRPETVQKGIVCVDIKGDMVTARYERDDDFRVLVKGLHYEWSSTDKAWRRKIGERQGDITDRAAELVNTLLRNGYIVTCIDADVRKKAINADYAAECERWIVRHSATDLCVRYPKDDTINEHVRAMGGRWSSDAHGYLVGMTKLDDLEELARLYEFSYTVRAQADISAYRAQIDAALPVQAAAKPVDDDKVDPVRAILKSSRAVLPDLMDNDEEDGIMDIKKLALKIYDYEIDNGDECEECIPSAKPDAVAKKIADVLGCVEDEAMQAIIDAAGYISEDGYHDFDFAGCYKDMQNLYVTDRELYEMCVERLNYTAWVAAKMFDMTI